MTSNIPFLAVLAGILLLSQVSHARDLGFDEAELEGPKRKLLATRTVSGKVWWADNSQAIAGAIVTAYDNDVIGKEKMGSAITAADGSYTISYTVKDWDFCCFSATNPDIVLEVTIGGRLYAKTGEYGNVKSNLSGRNIAVPRWIASGQLKWYETCTGANGDGKIAVLDDDLDADDAMGSGVTKSDGTYSVILPRSDGGSSWDPLGGDPDPFVRFTGPNGLAGQTSVKSDVKGTNPLLNYGTTWLWRNDPSAAKAVANAISGESKVDWVSVTEYTHCSPKKMMVTVKLDIGKAVFSAPPDSEVPRLKTLLKQGIAENWSRNGTRALTINGNKWDVHVVVVESDNGYSTSLKYASDVKKDCERSNNVGIPVLGLDLTLWYNKGCFQYAQGANWQTGADNEYKDTAAHEFGHSVLQNAVSLMYSWTHKGSSTIWQNPSDSATNYPASNDIDLMLYFKNGSPPTARTFATDQDVRRLISIAKTTYLKSCGSCPYGSVPASG